jgi:hypothetical protein
MEFDNNYIRKLLTLYEDGETTLEQEQELRAYFSSDNYDSEFEVYAIMFKSFAMESKANYNGEVKTPKTFKAYSWINIAASICIIVGALWFYNYQAHQQELEKARVAFEKTQNALNLLSINMNKGLEKLEYVEVFSEQKNKIIK